MSDTPNRLGRALDYLDLPNSLRPQPWHELIRVGGIACLGDDVEMVLLPATRGGDVQAAAARRRNRARLLTDVFRRAAKLWSTIASQQREVTCRTSSATRLQQGRRTGYGEADVDGVGLPAVLGRRIAEADTLADVLDGHGDIAGTVAAVEGQAAVGMGGGEGPDLSVADRCRGASPSVTTPPRRTTCPQFSPTPAPFASHSRPRKTPAT